MKLLCILFVAFLATLANAAEVTRMGIWELHSSFWMNLHQTLIHDAMQKTPRDVAALTVEEQSAWTAAVAAYRTAGGTGDMTFARPMMIQQDELSQVADGAVTPGITGPLAAAILQAAPVYRKHWWASDDSANRFFLGYATAMLRDAGDELARAHTAVYGEQLPKSIRVDISGHGGPLGAYTLRLKDAGWVITMSSRDAGYQGLNALEMLLHETSHSVVGPNNGTVAKAIKASADRLGIAIPPSLWHAVLFATSGELARRALAQRGVAHYETVASEVINRAWPQYRKPLETHWYPYLLSGTGTLDEAIARIVEAVRDARQ